jgi:hypothetical protein
MKRKKMSKFDTLIYETIMNLKLFEHAFHLKDAQIQIRGFAFPIGKHIMKLIIYKDNPNTEHWIDEIENWTAESYEILLKNGMYFTKDNYFKLLYTEPWEGYDDAKYSSVVQRIVQKNHDLEKYRIRISMSELGEKLKNALVEITEAMEKEDDMAIDRILRNL